MLGPSRMTQVRTKIAMIAVHNNLTAAAVK